MLCVFPSLTFLFLFSNSLMTSYSYFYTLQLKRIVMLITETIIKDIRNTETILHHFPFLNTVGNVSMIQTVVPFRASALCCMRFA